MTSEFKIGDRVRCLDRSLKFFNKIGTVERSDIEGKIKVRFEEGFFGAMDTDGQDIGSLEDYPDSIVVTEEMKEADRKKEQKDLRYVLIAGPIVLAFVGYIIWGLVKPSDPKPYNAQWEAKKALFAECKRLTNDVLDRGRLTVKENSVIYKTCLELGPLKTERRFWDLRKEYD